jgi:hypothetical protein
LFTLLRLTLLLTPLATRELGTLLPNPPFIDIVPLVFGIADASVRYLVSLARRRLKHRAGGLSRPTVVLALELQHLQGLMTIGARAANELQNSKTMSFY